MKETLLAKYEAAAQVHLDATFDLLEEIMGRSPTYREMEAAWTFWIKDLYKVPGQST